MLPKQLLVSLFLHPCFPSLLRGLTDLTESFFSFLVVSSFGAAQLQLTREQKCPQLPQAHHEAAPYVKLTLLLLLSSGREGFREAVASRANSRQPPGSVDPEHGERVLAIAAGSAVTGGHSGAQPLSGQQSMKKTVKSTAIYIVHKQLFKLPS